MLLLGIASPQFDDPEMDGLVRGSISGATRQGTGRSEVFADLVARGSSQPNSFAACDGTERGIPRRQGNGAGDSGPLRRFVVSERLLRFFAGLFAIPFPCQRFFHATLLTGLQVEGVALDFLNDVFLLDLPLEPAQCVFKGFPLLNSNFRQ